MYANTSAAPASARAPAPAGEVTAVARGPASTGRQEVPAPPSPRSSARPDVATSRGLHRPGSNGRYGKLGRRPPVRGQLLARELLDARDRLGRGLFRREAVDDDAMDCGPQRQGVILTGTALRVGQPPPAVDVRVGHALHRRAQPV